jgi:hypothetical protein
LTSRPATKPSQVVPASIVVKVITSNPEVVKDGAVPPTQSTDAGQFTVCDPPLVSIKVKVHDLPVAEGLLNVNVWVAVDTVAETTLPETISMSSVPPPVSPIAFTVSAMSKKYGL